MRTIEAVKLTIGQQYRSAVPSLIQHSFFNRYRIEVKVLVLMYKLHNIFQKIRKKEKYRLLIKQNGTNK